MKNEPIASDVGSIDAIIAAAYDVISGPAGKKRDWDRERSLFYPGARLIPTAKPGGNDALMPQILDLDGFIARAEHLQAGFACITSFYHAQLNGIDHSVAHAHVADDHHAITGRSEFFPAQKFLR